MAIVRFVMFEPALKPYARIVNYYELVLVVGHARCATRIKPYQYFSNGCPKVSMKLTFKILNLEGKCRGGKQCSSEHQTLQELLAYKD